MGMLRVRQRSSMAGGKPGAASSGSHGHSPSAASSSLPNPDPCCDQTGFRTQGQQPQWETQQTDTAMELLTLHAALTRLMSPQSGGLTERPKGQNRPNLP